MNDRYHTHGLGQVLLKSSAWIEKICIAANIEPGDFIIEIGPGRGALTHRVAEICQALSPGPELLLVEKDPDMARYLSPRLPDWIVLENMDFLDFDMRRIPKNTKIISNLPYSSSTAILIKLLRHHHGINRMVLMFQREVAVRIKADAGTRKFGRLAAMSQAFWHVRSLGVVPPGAFNPQPAVNSEVLVFHAKKSDVPDDFSAYETLVAAIFAHPRRTVENSMAMAMGVTKKIVREYLLCAGIDLKSRPSDLSVEQILGLFRCVR